MVLWNPEKLAKLAVIQAHHVSLFANYLAKLKATPDGDGSLLDHSMILYGSGMNSGKGGEHSPRNLPTLIAGGQKLGLKHGQHLAFDPDKHPPLSNVLLTMAQKMGVETEKFADATGTLPGLVG